MPRKTPRTSVRVRSPAAISIGPSIGIAMTMRVVNMIGARRKSVANGLEVAGCRSRRICVRAQRKPEKNADAMTSPNPATLKAVSPKTIITTPTVMVQMMRMSLTLGVSSLKRKAKAKTNANAEDLHMVKNVRVMNLRDMLPRPISSEVAVPHGTSLVR